MLIGFLFIVLLLNVSLTVMLYVKQNARREEEKAYNLRMQINKAARRFNQDSERNITLLEERIAELKDLIEKSKLLQFPSDNEVPPADDTHTKDTQPLSSFVQNAYMRGVQSENISNNITAFNVSCQSSNSPSVSPVKDSMPGATDSRKPLHKDFDEYYPSSNNQLNKTYQVARLIGEGRNQEEIAHAMNMSLSEVRLLITLVKKELTHVW